MAKRKPEIPPPKRGRGRPPKYVVGRDGKEIVGLSHRKSDGRYYATRAEPTVYFCTDFDAASARFREWEAKQHKDFVSLPAERPAGWFKGKEFQKGKPHLYVEVPLEAYDAMVLSADFWAIVSRAIRENPHLAAESTGLPLHRLYKFKEPEESIPLAEVGRAYLNRPEPIS